MGRTRRCHSGELLRSALLLLFLEAQASVLSSRSENPGRCQDPDEYYNSAAQRCCLFCPPGFRVRHHCNESIDTQCEACKENTYTKTSNSATRCFGCSSECKKGLVEVQACTPTQDRRCWCPPHEFCSEMLYDTCVRCQPHQPCRKGYGVANPGTDKSNVECTPCEPGTFSDVESPSATCRPHRVDRCVSYFDYGTGGGVGCVCKNRVTYRTAHNFSSVSNCDSTECFGERKKPAWKGSCEFQLLPGNSTNDAICGDFGEPGRIPVTSRQPTAKDQETSSPEGSLTTTLKVDVGEIQKEHPGDVAYIVGGLTTSVFLVVAIIVAVICLISRRKAAHCKQLFGGEKQQFSPTGNGPDKWPRVSSPTRQEEENLLKISPSSSGSLDYPPASDKSSGISDLEDPKKEVETSQRRSSPSNICVYHSRADSTQPGPGGTHVNISCVVNMCNPGHGLQLLPRNSSTDAEVSVGEDIPLSKEESPIQRAPERQTAVEDMDAFAYEEGKPLPLSVQDIGMKTR